MGLERRAPGWGSLSGGRFQRGAVAPGFEERGEFEIDDAEPPVGDAVGDVAEIAVLVADAVFLQFGEDLFLALGVERIDAAAAVGGDDLEVIGFDLDESRDERAAALLQTAQDADLVFEAFAGEVAAKGFVHASIVANAHEGAGGVFDFVHGDGRK